MSKNMKVEIEVTAKDSAAPVINKTTQETKKSFKQTEQAAQQSSKSQTEAARKTAQAREILGVRSERTIRRELIQTRAAYERLKRSGVASQNELQRAAEVTKKRVQELNTELGKTSFGDKMRGVGRGIMNIGAGIVAGSMVVAPKMMAAADYDMALARIADTGYSGGSIEEKNLGKEKIHQAIKTSVTQYGGTKEEALSAINELMAQGKVSVESALALLPTIQKNATATGASSVELTNMVNSMLQFGVKESEIQTALDYMNASGKAGGFELKDMAQYFPQVLANAGYAGLSGLEDLKKVGVNLQQVYGVSGGASETATNLNNYYAKVKAVSTANNLEKLEFTDAKGKKVGIDMKKSMQHYMNQGQNASEAMLSIIGDVLKHDKEYQALLTKYRQAQDKDKKAVMQKIAKYIEGTKVAEIMPDLQAGLATYAMRNDQKTAENVTAQYGIADKGDYNNDSFQYISQQSAFAFQQAKNNYEMEQIENFNKANNIAAEVAKEYSGFAQEFPNLNHALVGATEAVKAFGAALIGSELMKMLGGKIPLGRGGLGNIFRGGVNVATQTATASAVSTGASAGAGALAPIVAGAFGLFYSKELNEGELDKVLLMNKVASGEATPTELAQADAMYAKTRQDIEERRKRREAHQEMPFTQEQQAEYNRALAPILATLPEKIRMDTDVVGKTLSSAIEVGLASQSHTIANNITVELDGRVIAEQVSEQQFNLNKRM